MAPQRVMMPCRIDACNDITRHFMSIVPSLKTRHSHSLQMTKPSPTTPAFASFFRDRLTQSRAAADLKKRVTDGLVDAGLTYASAGAFSTPRRLALTVEGLTAQSPTHGSSWHISTMSALSWMPRDGSPKILRIGWPPFISSRRRRSAPQVTLLLELTFRATKGPSTGRS